MLMHSCCILLQNFLRIYLANIFRSLLYTITVLNYIAQIPYNLHFYYGSSVPPNYLGIVAFLLLTFALFIAGYLLTMRGKTSGGWLLLTFLVLEFIGYLVHNLTGAFLKDLPLSDPIFFTVSLIGYLNFVTSFVYIVIIAIYRHDVLFPRRNRSSHKL